MATKMTIKIIGKQNFSRKADSVHRQRDKEKKMCVPEAQLVQALQGFGLQETLEEMLQ